ncbi:MAG: hypothetical protein ACRDGS_00755 [Chloroflexota bacterium]
MDGRLRRLTWLAAVLGASWLTGAGLQAVPGSMIRQARDQPLDWLLPIAAAVVLLGYLLSRVAAVLGPPSIRSLLPPAQARWIAGLLAALVCITWTGLLWSNVLENIVATVFWQIFAGAAIDLFVLGWLCLALRAAASTKPAVNGLILLGSALTSLVVSYCGLILLVLAFQRYGWEINLPLVGLLVVLLTGIFLLPPVMAIAGMAAVFTSLTASKDGGTPPII